MLRPLKSEIEAIASMLTAGAESPEALATEVIKKVEQLRGEREQWIIVFELSPGVYSGYGPCATRAEARKKMPNMLMAQLAKRAAVVPVLGLDSDEKCIAKSDAPLEERGDFKLVREDAAAFKRGWRGKQIDRHNYASS